MKKWGILLLAGLVGALVLTGCQPAVDLSGYLKASDITCTQCHNLTGSGNVIDGPAITTAKTGYPKSGHALGLRAYDFSGASPVIAHEGSLSESEYAGGCAKCHTADGFVNWATNGPQPYTFTSKYSAYVDYQSLAYNTAQVQAGSTISCLTCHNTATHELRLNEASVALASGMTAATYTTGTTNTWDPANAVNMVQTVATLTGNLAGITSGTTYDGGAGNLCVNCHQDRTTPASLNYKLGLVTYSSSAGTATTYAGNTGTATTNTYVTVSRVEHHGVQGDFLLGTDSAGKTTNVTNGYQVNSANPTFTTSPHYTYVTDTCVACHVLKNSTGHENYLVTDAGVDNVALCQTCHTSTADKAATTFVGIKATTNNLKNLDTAQRALLTYFGKPSNFMSSASSSATALSDTTGNAPVQKLSTSGTAVAGLWAPATTDGIVWNKDWTYNSSNKYMTQAQAQALWNLMLFYEDRSLGVHNPQYAAQLLYDAEVLVSLDPSAIWSIRP